MEREKSLIKANDSIFSKIFKSIKSIFHKLRNKANLKTYESFESQENTDLEDFEVLKDVINGKIEIKDLDIDLEKRLIVLCNNRINEINKKIAVKDLEIAKLRKKISSQE